MYNEGGTRIVVMEVNSDGDLAFSDPYIAQEEMPLVTSADVQSNLVHLGLSASRMTSLAFSASLTHSSSVDKPSVD